MKKSLVILILFDFFSIQSQTRKSTNIQPDYENIFYKGSKIIVDRIIYTSQFDSADSDSDYWITIKGSVKGNKEEL